MRAIDASALFCLLLLPACPWAQNPNHINDGRMQQLAAANTSLMNSDSSSSAPTSSSREAASPEGSAINASASSFMLVSPMLQPSPMAEPVVAMVEPVAPVPQPTEKERINPWTAPLSSRRFVAANSFLLFSWTADIEGTHFCLVRRT